MAHGWQKHLRAPHFFAAAALCAIAFAVYSNSFQAGFTLDSKQAILNDERIREAGSRNFDLILNHTYWWPYDQSGLYRPLTTASYLFNYAVLRERDRPAGYHWINLLLHLANVLLVYAIAWRLLGNLWQALCISCTWAVHPVLTESVTNIVGRADLLAGLGMLAGFWFYLRKQWIGVFFAAAIGIFSKESAVVLPAVIGLYELTAGKRFRLPALVTLVPIAVYLWLRSNVLAAALPSSIPFTDNPLIGADFWTAKLTALSVIGRYVWLLVWPAKLSADYSWAQIPLGVNWFGLLTAVAAAALAALAFRWNRVAFFFAGFAFLAFLPTANLLFPVGTIMAERFLYLPAIGFAACLVMALWRLSPRFAPAALCVIAAALAVRTYARNPDWRDDTTMANAMAQASPHSFKAHRLLAYQLFHAHADMSRVLAEAEKSLKPLESLPDSENSADTWRLAAGYYYSAGKYERSAQLAERALAIVNDEQARTQGAVYAGAGDLYKMLAEDYRRAGEPDKAAIILMQAQLRTGDMAFRKLLLDLYASGLDRAGCAVVPGPAGPALNPSCEIVHRHLCAALQATGKSAEFQQYGCR